MDFSPAPFPLSPSPPARPTAAAQLPAFHPTTPELPRGPTCAPAHRATPPPAQLSPPRAQAAQPARQPSSAQASRTRLAAQVPRALRALHARRAWRTPAAAATTQLGARASGALLFIFLEPPRTISSARRPVFSPRTPTIPCAVLAHRCFASPNRRPERRRRRAGRLPLAVEVSSPPSSLSHSSLDVLLTRRGRGSAEPIQPPSPLLLSTYC
jgi:hypothetical protein